MPKVAWVFAGIAAVGLIVAFGPLESTYHPWGLSQEVADNWFEIGMGMFCLGILPFLGLSIEGTDYG